MDQHLQNVPRALLERAPVPALTTINGVVMSVVYVTAPAPFTGILGGTSTQSSDDDTPSTTRAIISPSGAILKSGRSTSTSSSPISSTAQSANAPFTFGPSSTYGYASPTNNYDPASQTAVFGSSESNNTSSSSANSGMSIGAKIGLGAGIIVGVGIVAIIALFFLAKKRKQIERQAQADTEKKAAMKPEVADLTAQSSPAAPRLSLRPVSRILPEFIGGQQKNHNNRLSQGNMLTPISEAGSTKLRSLSPVSPQSQGLQAYGNQARDNPFKDPENPFKDPEKAIQGTTPTSAPPASSVPGPTIPAIAVSASEPPRDQRISGPNGESFPLPQSQPPSHGPIPPHTARAQPSLAPIAVPPPSHYVELPAASSPGFAHGSGQETPAGNVYRILMDFRPTMDDELELRAGQLVRMLHEYDDGWALCIRLDRSQQGVVPRTCLAVKPSKPRPGPPPMGPNGHPMAPQNRSRAPPRPQESQGPPGPGYQSASPSPVQNPSLSPVATGEFNQPPRPLSPGPRPQPPPAKRSQSPGPYAAGGPKPMAPELQRRRSNSASAANTENKFELPAGPTNLAPSAPPPVRSNSPGLAI